MLHSAEFQHKILIRVVRAVDLLLVWGLLVIALAVSSDSLAWYSLSYLLAIRIKVVNLLFLGGYLAFCSAVLSGCGFYNLSRRVSRRLVYGEVLQAVSILSGALLLFRGPLDLKFATTPFLGIFWIGAFCAFVLSREASLRLWNANGSHRKNFPHVIIVEEDRENESMVSRIRQDENSAYHILRIIRATEDERNDQLDGNL